MSLGLLVCRLFFFLHLQAGGQSLYHCPSLPTRNLGSRVSGLVSSYNVSTCVKSGQEYCYDCMDKTHMWKLSGQLMSKRICCGSQMAKKWMRPLTSTSLHHLLQSIAEPSPPPLPLPFTTGKPPSFLKRRYDEVICAIIENSVCCLALENFSSQILPFENWHGWWQRMFFALLYGLKSKFEGNWVWWLTLNCTWQT